MPIRARTLGDIQHEKPYSIGGTVNFHATSEQTPRIVQHLISRRCTSSHVISFLPGPCDIVFSMVGNFCSGCVLSIMTLSGMVSPAWRSPSWDSPPWLSPSWNFRLWTFRHGLLHRGKLQHGFLHRGTLRHRLSVVNSFIAELSGSVFSIMTLSGMVSPAWCPPSWGSPTWRSPSWSFPPWTLRHGLLHCG